MIEISSTLESAAIAESRSPIVKAYVDNPSSFTMLTDLYGSTNYIIHKVVTLSSSWIAFATRQTYKDYYDNKIYYNIITDIGSATDWENGWTLLADIGVYSVKLSALDAWSDGSSHVLFVYHYNSGGSTYLYFRESDNGGSSWSSAAQVGTESVDSVPYLAIGDDERVFYTKSSQLKSAYRTYSSPGDSWTTGSVWIYGAQYWRWYGLTATPLEELASSDEHFMITFSPALRSDIYWEGNFVTTRMEFRSYNQTHDHWGPMLQCLGREGGTITNDYIIRSLSKEPIGDYYFALIGEEYQSMLDLMVDSRVNTLYIGKTEDFNSYSVIAIPDIIKHLKLRSTIDYPFSTVTMPGFLYDNDNVVVVATAPYIRTRIYTAEKTAWWGFESAAQTTEITDDLIGNVNISFSSDQSSSASIELSNRTFQYINSETVKPGSILSIEAGYNTSSGEELQQRFTGPIVNVDRRIDFPNSVSVKASDMYYKATSVKAHKPSLIAGTNVLHVDFSDVLDTDYFVPHGGTWSVSGGKLKQTKQGEKVYTVAGMDYNNARMAIVKVRSYDEIKNNKFGVLIQLDEYTGWESDDPKGYVVIFNAQNKKFELCSFLESDEDMTLTVEKSTSLGFSIYPGVYYWLMVTWMYSTLSCWYSTNGKTWTNVWSDEELAALAPDGYVGLYCEIDEGRSTSTRIEFDEVLFVSMKPPIDGSGVVKALAVSAGLEVEEVCPSYDIFDYTAANFNQIIQTGKWIKAVGGWTTSNGKLQFVPSGSSTKGRLLSVAEGSNMVVTATFYNLGTSWEGLLLRSDIGLTTGYMAKFANGSVQIMKRIDESTYTTLRNVTIDSNRKWYKFTFAARGNCLMAFVDDVLITAVTDDKFTDGYAGIAVGNGRGYPGGADVAADFKVSSLYMPEDMVVVRPGDSVASIIDQVLSKYDEAGCFVDYHGRLKFGSFPRARGFLESEYMNTESIIVASNLSDVSDKIINIARITGNLSSGEYRNENSMSKLGMARYVHEENKSISTGAGCYDEAKSKVENSLSTIERTLSIFGQPQLELYDTIAIPMDSAPSYTIARILGFSETIGTTYEQNISELDNYLDLPSPYTGLASEQFVVGTVEIIAGDGIIVSEAAGLPMIGVFDIADYAIVDESVTVSII